MFIVLLMLQGVVESSGTVSLPSIPYEDWMSYFPETRILDLPIIPGSHNSGSSMPAHDLPGCRRMLFPWARQQSLSIGSQLRVGIRMLDIRLHVLEDMSIRISHRFDTSYLFVDVLDEVKNFLLIHRSEFVVLYLRIDYDNPLDEKFQAKQQEAIDNVISTSGIPIASLNGVDLPDIRVEQLAGQVLILSPSGSIFHPESSTPFLDSNRFYRVRDIWRCNFVHGPCGARARLDSYMCEGFAQPSGLQGIAIDMTCPGLTPSLTSPGMNSWFLHKLREDTRWIHRLQEGPLGILTLDFVNRNVLRSLIKLNLEHAGIHVTDVDESQGCTFQNCFTFCFHPSRKRHSI